MANLFSNVPDLLQMKIVLLTTDTVDGRIVLDALKSAKIDLAGIVYEPRPGRVKTRVKALLRHLPARYESESIPVRVTADIHQAREFLSALKPDLFVVVGTRKIRPEIFQMAPQGAINLHTGLLPAYRGADSEFWALYQKEPDQVGVTILHMDAGLDSGDILLTQKQGIEPGDDYISLHKKNLTLGAEKIVETIRLMEKGQAKKISQNETEARSYRSVPASFAKERVLGVLQERAVLKSFGGASLAIREMVAENPTILFRKGCETDYPNTFGLRIDADEFHPETFPDFMKVLEKYKKAVTIFFNAASFESAKDCVADCAKRGFDIQSHSYYHTSYSDYPNNRMNYDKAEVFFKNFGIQVSGFAVPTGRFNAGLLKVLEDKGCRYSSDFSYDYLAPPSYPAQHGRFSEVLQIPVFPISPELFFEAGHFNDGAINHYYAAAVDEMERCGIPAFVYGHTSFYKNAPGILDAVCDYALNQKKLEPITMTAFDRAWRTRCWRAQKRKLELPREEFLGKKTSRGFVKEIKFQVKRAFDFETITPLEDLRASAAKKFLLRAFRGQNKILNRGNKSAGYGYGQGA